MPTSTLVPGRLEPLRQDAERGPSEQRQDDSTRHLKARRVVVQRSSGKGAEDALIADAMIRIRDNEDAERSRKKAVAQRRRDEKKSLSASKAQVAEEQRRLCKERARLRLVAEVQTREQAA